MYGTRFVGDYTIADFKKLCGKESHVPEKKRPGEGPLNKENQKSSIDAKHLRSYNYLSKVRNRWLESD